MGKEIERKFLVQDERWRNLAEGIPCRQGYIHVGPPAAVRVRIAGDRAYLNLKQATLDIERDEFEYEIPLEDAETILERLCQGRIVEKTRYLVPVGEVTWEVDVFSGANEGLTVAEIELDEVASVFELPPWAGREVSGDPRYLNSNLALHPYCEWKDDA